MHKGPSTSVLSGVESRLFMTYSTSTHVKMGNIVCRRAISLLFKQRRPQSWLCVTSFRIHELTVSNEDKDNHGTQTPTYVP